METRWAKFKNFNRNTADSQVTLYFTHFIWTLCPFYIFRDIKTVKKQQMNRLCLYIEKTRSLWCVIHELWGFSGRDLCRWCIWTSSTSYWTSSSWTHLKTWRTLPPLWSPCWGTGGSLTALKRRLIHTQQFFSYSTNRLVTNDSNNSCFCSVRLWPLLAGLSLKRKGVFLWWVWELFIAASCLYMLISCFSP